MNFVWTRAIFIYWIAIDLYIHLLNISVREYRIKCIKLTILLTFLTYWLDVVLGPACISLSILLFVVALFLQYRNELMVTCVMGMLAYGLGFFVYLFNSFLFMEINLRLFPDFQGPFNVLMYVLVGMISIIMCEGIFKIKRLRKGVKLGTQPRILFVFFALDVILYVCILLATFRKFTFHADKNIHLLIFCLSGIVFLIVWKISITCYYRKNMRGSKIDSYQQELDERDMQIKLLTESNDGLARIIHRDNKLVPAMLASVQEYLRCAAEEPETLAERGRELSERLGEMAAGREGILKSYEEQRNGGVHSGHAGIDAVITYMQDRAKEHKVQCEFKVDSGFSDLIPERISEVDCAHLLSDLMDNARIAMERCDERKMLVHLGVVSDFPVIEVSDSGVPFDPAVYQDFGMIRHSTHLGEGGSGIGLMDIWELKKKYRASLHIHEYSPESGPYTKKLTLVFDGKGHYLIETYRQSEVASKKVRGDLYIISAQ